MSWSAQGELHLTGLVRHGGSQSLDRTHVAAWQVGDRLVVAYELTGNRFPEAPVPVCPAFTHVDIVFPILAVRPRTVSFYGGSLRYRDREDVVVAP